MNQVLPQMAALIVCGVLLRFFKPSGMDPDSVRRVITGLVYILLLPALVLSVLWKTHLGLETFEIALVAAVGVLGALLVIHLLFRNSSAPDDRPRSCFSWSDSPGPSSRREEMVACVLAPA